MSKALDWTEVVAVLRERSFDAPVERLNAGQRSELRAIAERLPRNGVLIADEVGMGKTRIAVEIVRAVEHCGGRTAILIPPGLGFQWQGELRQGGVNPPPVLRSLWGYLEAWRSPDDRLKQWYALPTLVLSHRFTNWAPRESGESWRWALLPAVAARLIKEKTRRTPNYGSHDKLSDPWVQECARDISTLLQGDADASLVRLRESLLAQDLRDHGSLLSGASYQTGEVWREWLERVVGAGLGTFDLIVVDEAHKSRGHESGLTRLLSNTVLTRANARNVALTATPVELDESQWINTLHRAGLRQEDAFRVSEAIKNYAESARRVRARWRSDPDGRRRYAVAAREFQRELSPYLVRRDKREDDAVKRFARHVGAKSVDAYRHEHEIAVEINALSLQWRKAVLATEALSIACAGLDENRLKRLRLTMANGHGVAAALDDDGRAVPLDRDPATGDVPLRKRFERIAWWKGLLQESLRGDATLLFNHPGILAACHAIEQEHRAGNKVLVFGRFTAPMRALTGLLNAREMLTRIRGNRPWPQAKVHGNERDPPEHSDWPAVRAAAVQLGIGASMLQELDTQLELQYRELENRREQFRTALPGRLDRALSGTREHATWELLKRTLETSEGDHSLVALLARAIGELTGALESEAANVDDSQVAEAFADIVAAVSDQDTEADEDGKDQGKSGASLVARFRATLVDEFQTSQGVLARLMYGSTSLPSRRMMQAAFNRESSLLRVLVAQSSVGREGLNLHKACRIVVNLHPEWNPAVAEQQIGRVDRVGSLWARECARAVEENQPPEALPRIEIRPVIFRGTYDEHHWAVLRERWDDLRAQLHGIVVPTRHAGSSMQELEILDWLSKCAPDFSPARGEPEDAGAPAEAAS